MKCYLFMPKQLNHLRYIKVEIVLDSEKENRIDKTICLCISATKVISSLKKYI